MITCYEFIYGSIHIVGSYFIVHTKVETRKGISKVRKWLLGLGLVYKNSLRF